MKYTKMHGLGNDYLYVFGKVPGNIKELAIRLSDRHFGAGSDGMIFIEPSTVADFKMRIFNADGSEAKMCGNGIRCVGKYVYDKKLTDKTRLSIETMSGIKQLEMDIADGRVRAVTVQMGKAEVSEELRMDLHGREWNCIPVDVGNPHAVIFVEDAEQVPLEEIGPLAEHHRLFPGGVNTEFVQVMGENELRMRVWERGSGITMACGTGACASAAAAVKKGLCEYDRPVFVHLDGGILQILVSSDGSVLMTGPAVSVYDAEVSEEFLLQSEE